MFFRRKKKLKEEEIEQIVDGYSKAIKDVLSKYLPRRARRFMNKKKSGIGLTADKKNEEVQKIKKVGINNWLNQSTRAVLEEISSFVADPVSLRSELDAVLKKFKKKWKIK